MSNQDSTRTIAQNAKRFFSGTLISRFTGLAREVTMAAAFGTDPAVAAFWMAFRFSHLLRRLFGEGALHTVFVPHFESLRKEDPKKGASFFYTLSTGITLILFLLCCLGEGILGGFLLFGSLSQGNQEVVRLTMIMLPALIFISLYALNNSLLNCEKIFFLPSVAPTALNVLWIAAIVFFWKLPTSKAIEYLSMVIVFAFALQWLVTLPKILGYLKEHFAQSEERQRFVGKNLLKLLRPFALGMLGVAATQINSALDALFARAADPEGPAFLWYALRIQQLPLALVGVALTGSLLPPISRALEAKERGKYLIFLSFAVEKGILLLLPITAALFVLGFSGMNLVYGHGEFSQNALLETTYCLWGYGFGLVPMALVLIFAAALYAQKNYKTPTLISLFCVTLNIGLNAWFVYVLKLGAMSIALATAISACVNCLLLVFALKELSIFKRLLFFVLKVLFSSTVAGFITLYFSNIWLHDTTWLFLTKRSLAVFPKEPLVQLYVFLGSGFLFVGTFLIMAFFLRLPLLGSRTQKELPI